MTFQIAGHRAAVETLRRSLTNPAHAYLLLGPARVGKTTLAFEYAKALNCLSEDRPCQQCLECLLIAKEGHPDVTLVVPNEKGNVSIDEVRRLRLDLSLRPNQARKRVVILPADRLTEPAADALLKTLEEPPDHAVIILTGHDLDAIPETIVSRCRLLLLGFVDASDIDELLREKGVEQTVETSISTLAFGAPGWALEASEDPDILARRQTLQADLERWTTGSLRDRLAAAEALGAGGLDRARVQAMEELELMLAWWRDVLVAASGAPDLVSNTKSQDRIQTLAANTGTSEILALVREISTAATRISENVDPRLALEALAVSTP